MITRIVTSRLGRGLSIVAVLALCAACEPTPEPEPWPDDTFVFDVDLADDVTRITDAMMDVVVDADTENHVYTLSASAADEAGLDLSIGRVLIIDGIAVRRIVGVEMDEDDVLLATEFVPLNEAITDGVIEWDYGVEFTPERVTEVAIPDEGVVIDTSKQPISFSAMIGEFTYAIEASLGGDVSMITFTVTKGVGPGVESRFTVDGEIERFRSRNCLVFADGELMEFDHQLNGMRGDLTLELVVVASGRDVVNLNLPVTVMKVPFTIGFLPVELNIRIQFVINASVPVDGSSRVRADFSYDSDLGFSFDGVGVSAGGSLGSITFGEDVNETGASSPISANFGVGFPRVQLNILGDTLVPWAQTAFLIGGSFTPMFPACQTADAEFLGAAGYSFELLGFPLASGSVTFFDETYELLRTAECPDDEMTATLESVRGALDESLVTLPLER